MFIFHLRVLEDVLAIVLVEQCSDLVLSKLVIVFYLSVSLLEQLPELKVNLDPFGSDLYSIDIDDIFEARSLLSLEHLVKVENFLGQKGIVEGDGALLGQILVTSLDLEEKKLRHCHLLLEGDQ